MKRKISAFKAIIAGLVFICVTATVGTIILQLQGKDASATATIAGASLAAIGNALRPRHDDEKPA